MRIIGIELRLRVSHSVVGLIQKEIAVIPCDIEVCVPEHFNFAELNGTLHTDRGDINIGLVNIDPFFLRAEERLDKAILHKNRGV